MTTLSKVLLLVALVSWSPASRAAEGGSGVYLLGLRTTGAGITPPPGAYVSDQVFSYNGKIEGRLPTEGGAVTVKAQVSPLVSVPSIQWVTPLEIFGGRVGVSATTPYGRVRLKASAGPLSVEDSITTFADPIVTSFVGWRASNLHLQIGASGYLPWGDYEKGALANIAKHRLALDLFSSVTYFDPGTGIDITNVVGITLNAENTATRYKTGDELHWDWAVSKKFSNGLSVGAIGYVYNQLTDDSGAGASLGAFKGRVTAVGGSLGYDFKLGQLPVSTRARYYHEFDVVNRFQGDALFLSASMPLWVPQSAGR